MDPQFIRREAQGRAGKCRPILLSGTQSYHCEVQGNRAEGGSDTASSQEASHPVAQNVPSCPRDQVWIETVFKGTYFKKIDFLKEQF